MELFKTKMPNCLTFVFENGDLYTFLIDFPDGENFGMLQQRWSNPLSWDGIFIGAGKKTVHFIDLKKIRHFYYSTLSDSEFGTLKAKAFTSPNLDVVTGVGHGILVAGEDLSSQKGPRVQDIPGSGNENSPA